MPKNRSRISEVDARLYRVPNEAPAGDAIQKFTALELPLVRITDEAGRVGVGFGYTIGRGGSAIVELLREELLPQIAGQDAISIRGLVRRLRLSIHALTPGCISSNALAAIDIALWDLAGKRTGAPLHVLLGGAKERVPVYNTDVGWLSRPIEELVELCERAIRRDGFSAVKLKVGKPDPQEDRERLIRVRKAIGPQALMMSDANQSWTPGEAAKRLKHLADLNLLWIEEPLKATDVQGYQQLRRRTQIPIAGGESLYAPAQFYECVRLGALDIVQPDIARVGGISAALEVCHLAQAAGLPVSTHVSPEISIAVAAAVPNSIYVEYVPQLERVLARPLRIADGFAYPFAGPGHAIEFDESALARYEVKHELTTEKPGIAAD